MEDQAAVVEARAHLSPDVVMPPLHRPVPNVAIVWDTSGSLPERLLARALAEVESVLARRGLRQAQVRVLAVDTHLHAVPRVSRLAEVQLAGGVGTDMKAGIRAAIELRPRPSIVIALTDGFTPWPERPLAAIRVVVGLISEGAGPPRWAPPEWARR